MYQTDQFNFNDRSLCDIVNHDNYCICSPGSEDCKGLEVKLNDSEAGVSCGFANPTTVEGGVLEYQWHCQRKTNRVYILSSNHSPIRINEIIVTASHLSKSRSTLFVKT